ncbi:MAG: cytochrome C oxidase subunit IV family protein [Ilumatobacteraceae bacterium]
MSIDIEHDTHGTPGVHVEEHDDHGLSDKGYVMIALLLAVLTGMEVALSYAGLPGGVFMFLLIGLMLIKFFTVVSFFMHLKFDNKLFSWLFYGGLFLAVGVYAGTLATFHFFQPG